MTQQADRPAAEGRLVVGLVRGVHGLRGAVRVEILTDNPDRFAVGSVVYPEGGDRALTIREAHRDGPGLLVKFAEVRNRDAADALRDTYLEAATTERPEASFYWHEIIGCAVRTTAGEDLGTVDDVFRVGESDVFVVHGPRGEVLVPAVAAIVAELAPAVGRIVVDERALGLVDAADDDTEQP